MSDANKKNTNPWMELEKKDNLNEVVDNTNIDLSTVVSDISKKNKKKELRPLPSLNVMKKRLIQLFTERKNKLMKSFSSLLWNPFKLNDAVNQVREENTLINNFAHKDLEDIKKAYFKYFWYKHGMQDKEDGV